MQLPEALRISGGLHVHRLWAIFCPSRHRAPAAVGRPQRPPGRMTIPAAQRQPLAAGIAPSAHVVARRNVGCCALAPDTSKLVSMTSEARHKNKNVPILRIEFSLFDENPFLQWRPRFVAPLAPTGLKSTHALRLGSSRPTMPTRCTTQCAAGDPSGSRTSLTCRCPEGSVRMIDNPIILRIIGQPS